MKADNAGLGDAAQSHHPSCAGEHPSPLTARDGEDLKRWNRSEKHQNFSEGVPTGPVRGKCRITSCQFISFSCTEDLHPERFFRVNIRRESERAGGGYSTKGVAFELQFGIPILQTPDCAPKPGPGAVAVLEIEEFEVMLGRARRLVEVVVVAMWIGMLIVSVATSGRDGGSPLASNPLGHLICALLIAAVGGLLLAERAHYVGIYERGVNRGLFRMGNAAISRLVVGSGMCLVLAGILIGVLSLRRLISP